MRHWFNPQVLYVLWLREMKRYLRARSRIIGSLGFMNPLFYGVDGLRYSLIGISKFSPLIDAAVLFSFCSFMVGLGAFLFSRSDVD